MSTDISPENEQFIEREIASGVYRSRAEVLDAGVRLLREKKDLLARLDEGRRQLDAGEYTEYDDETLRARFDQLGQRAREAGQSNRDAK